MGKATRGTLVAVGGAEDKRDSMTVLRRALELVPGTARRVEIIPTASGDPREAARPYFSAFRDLGAEEVGVLDIRTREEAADAAYVERIRSADLVYMTGGDQARLSEILVSTPVHAAMREKLAAGGVVAGTSAGAAAMSSTMIAQGIATLRKGNVDLSHGLGLMPGAIIDTHFTERGRFGRLLEAIATHPELLGIGIGENTAVVMRGSSLEVVGAGSVVIFDGQEIRYSNAPAAAHDEPLAVDRLILHTLPSGHHYDLARHRAYAPVAPTRARRSAGAASPA
ncbi:MAG TPA: cyanophycinase [Candidatus Thermoplasmatota archaeon]|nr:cyanophycinase [Candidatus Thermoplasmatota archaeon]